MIVGSYVISRQIISPASAEEQAQLIRNIIAFLPLYVALICLLVLIIFSPICNRFFEDEDEEQESDEEDCDQLPQ